MSIFLIFLFIISQFNNISCQTINGLNGTGTINDPYKISNITRWRLIGSIPNKYWKLVNPINFNNNILDKIGNSTHPFIGYFDGSNNKISNLRFQIFGEILNSTITNILLDNVRNQFSIINNAINSNITNIYILNINLINLDDSESGLFKNIKNCIVDNIFIKSMNIINSGSDGRSIVAYFIDKSYVNNVVIIGNTYSNLPSHRLTSISVISPFASYIFDSNIFNIKINHFTNFTNNILNSFYTPNFISNFVAFSINTNYDSILVIGSLNFGTTFITQNIGTSNLKIGYLFGFATNINITNINSVYI
jgi:hypothetical protein